MLEEKLQNSEVSNWICQMAVRYTARQIYEWMNGWLDGWMDGSMEGRKKGGSETFANSGFILSQRYKL